VATSGERWPKGDKNWAVGRDLQEIGVESWQKKREDYQQKLSLAGNQQREMGGRRRLALARLKREVCSSGRTSAVGWRVWGGVRRVYLGEVKALESFRSLHNKPKKKLRKRKGQRRN